MADICETHLPIDNLNEIEVCEECHTSFIARTSLIDVPETDLSLALTLRYRSCVTPLGFGLGKHIYSTTLVPGEEIELEFFRSEKVTDELSQQYSVEETFAQELSSTIQNEWSLKQGSNFKVGGGANASLDLGIFKIGGEGEAEQTTQEDVFRRSFGEFVRKTQAKVARKFDFHVDTKTETVESSRSTRTLRNFNQCQPVTYNYFQLMRRLRFELILDALNFDVVPTHQENPVLTTRLNLLNVARFTPPRPQEILGSLQPSLSELPSLGDAVAPQPPVSAIAQATVQHPIIAEQFNEPVRLLDIEQLEADSEAQGAVLEMARRLIDRYPVGEVAHSEELCVNTTSATVEAFTGSCVACDTHTALVMQAEHDKLRLELLKTKEDAIASAAVHGFVRSPSGPVLGAVVRLRKGNTVIGETVTDDDGFYVLASKGFAVGGDTLVVDVPRLPTDPRPVGSVSPASGSFKGNDIPVKVDFVVS